MSAFHITPPEIMECIRAFGIDAAKSRRVTITFEIGNIVVVEAELYADKDAIRVLTTTMRKFKLVPIDD